MKLEEYNQILQKFEDGSLNRQEYFDNEAKKEQEKTNQKFDYYKDNWLYNNHKPIQLKREK